MAKTTRVEPQRMSHAKPLRVCFSFAAYAKNLVLHLKDSNIPVEIGLSEEEFSDLESTLGFKFPPDLRAVLQEGLPIGPGFPNWRSSSRQQLEILIRLPVLGICKDVLRNGFWVDDWGERPKAVDRAVKLASEILKGAPVLVPVYKNFYIPSEPVLAGNPVLYVDGGDVSVWSFDISGFFQRVQFSESGEDVLTSQTGLRDVFTPPVWAAKEAREIEFWTDLATNVENRVTSGENVAPHQRWWSNGVLGGCLEEISWKLRDGGWKEEDVKEMMMMDECDEVVRDTRLDEPLLDRECVRKRVRLLSISLLRAGWSTKDVVESFGFTEDSRIDGEPCFDVCHESSCEQTNTTVTLRSLMGLSLGP